MTDKQNKKNEAAVEEKTTAHLIWDEIKDRKIDMFALPNQVVKEYCAPVFVEPTRLYLTCTAGSVLPALEAAFGNAFTYELGHKYVILSRAAPKL